MQRSSFSSLQRIKPLWILSRWFSFSPRAADASVVYHTDEGLVDDSNAEDISTYQDVLLAPEHPERLYKTPEARDSVSMASRLVGVRGSKEDEVVNDGSNHLISQQLVKEINKLIKDDPPSSIADFEYLIDYISPYRNVYTLSLRLTELLIEYTAITSNQKGRTPMPSAGHCHKLLSQLLLLLTPHSSYSLLEWLSTQNEPLPIKPTAGLIKSFKAGLDLMAKMNECNVSFDPIVPTFLLWHAKSQAGRFPLVHFLPLIESNVLLNIGGPVTLGVDAYNAVLIDLLRRKMHDKFIEIYRQRFSTESSPHQLSQSLYHEYCLRTGQSNEESMKTARSLMLNSAFVATDPSLMMRVLQRYIEIDDYRSASSLLEQLPAKLKQLDPLFDGKLLARLARAPTFDLVKPLLARLSEDCHSTAEYYLLLYRLRQTSLLDILATQQRKGKLTLEMVDFLIICFTKLDQPTAKFQLLRMRLYACFQNFAEQGIYDTFTKDKRGPLTKAIAPLKSLLVDIIGYAEAEHGGRISRAAMTALVEYLSYKEEARILEAVLLTYRDQSRLSELMLSSPVLYHFLFAAINRREWSLVMDILSTLSNMPPMPLSVCSLKSPELASLFPTHRPALYFFTGRLLGSCITARKTIRDWLSAHYLIPDRASMSSFLLYLREKNSSAATALVPLVEKEKLAYVGQLRKWLKGSLAKEKLGQATFDSIEAVLHIPQFVKLHQS